MTVKTPAKTPATARTLGNGLTVLVEPIGHVRSVSARLVVPAGAASDPADRLGCATLLGEMVWRGAGGRDSRTLIDHLDALGLQRASGAGVERTTFAFAGLAASVLDALPAYADVVARPRLADDALPPARDLALQALAGVADDPAHRLGIALAEWFWPAPFGRNAMGDPDHLPRITADAVRHQHAARYVPAGSVLAVAGAVDADDVLRRAEATFGDWRGGDAPRPEAFPPPGLRHHEHADSEQTQIGLAFPTVPPSDDRYYAVRLAVECLGGGSSARLFTEVREKRGLCYGVGAGYAHAVTHAGVFVTAGTTPDRAADTLAAVHAELDRWRTGDVTADELRRAKVGLLSATVMAGDSTASRAASLAADWHTLGRLRTLDEIKAAIDAVTLDDVNAHLRAPAPPTTLVTVGPSDLTA